jgi:hypothetical protein
VNEWLGGTKDEEVGFVACYTFTARLWI